MQPEQIGGTVLRAAVVRTAARWVLKNSRAT